MNQPPKPLSLASIHDVYSGATHNKPERSTEEKAAPAYRTTKQFARDPAHTGTAPTRPTAPNTRIRSR
ncbi:hypothetical protein SAMN05216570_2622 [Dyella sp. OK004]|uniref:hypothetical protein n=1 Tax=Dyella sp. OK004 TaxID=1855292 RepID=UPI0008E0208A|nr:hypothetical protein [Dyella sp. OK004]SFS12166.1 hypothetical protein SAMN05216570_2622 [Dyella sp. OK004]